MFLPVSKVPAQTLAAIAIASFAAVGFALIAQHGFDVKPCPWCVMQRGIFLLIGAVSALAWAFALSNPQRKAMLGVVLALAVCGVAAAVFQHQVAANLESCAMTLADRINTALGLEDRWPYVFMVTASCAEAAAYRLLGLSYDIWSGLLFLLIAAAGLRAIVRR
ncbi:disulfide bond formation protein B [Pelomonas sp. KK5]|uniref:disulfide bond formation protein B n=1 Tax=Pelomonas sp. KK5 TaxID=1855730 RepID=UPI00097BF558|nr:disulfide bond formation protein B [Pelomonas sp. KK5]